MASGAKGGDALIKYLNKVSENLRNRVELRVGFLENAKYDDGTPVAYIAAIQEFGATIRVEPHTTTIYRKLNAAGTAFLRNGRFVKRRHSNFASDHHVDAYTITIPSRPFFRNAISQYGGSWGADMGTLLAYHQYNGPLCLRLMGERIVGQIVQSIDDTTTPPNAPSTVRAKGFDKPLVDSGHLRNSVGYDVKS